MPLTHALRRAFVPRPRMGLPRIAWRLALALYHVAESIERSPYVVVHDADSNGKKHSDHAADQELFEKQPLGFVEFDA